MDFGIGQISRDQTAQRPENAHVLRCTGLVRCRRLLRRDQVSCLLRCRWHERPAKDLLVGVLGSSRLLHLGTCRHDDCKCTQCPFCHYEHQQVLLCIQLLRVGKRQSGRKDSHHLFKCSSTKILVPNEAEESGQDDIYQNIVDQQR